VFHAARLTPLVGLILAAPIQASAAPPMPPQGVSLDAYLQSRALHGDFSGDVIVELKGAILLSRGYGKADFELGVPNDGTGVFRIGSLSKPLTAMAVLKLQEEQKLVVDDSICKFLVECPPTWAVVRLRHLLSHTSGIPDYFSEVSSGPPNRMREYIDRTVKAHLSSELASKPGETFSYSNFGYLLLGYVCEIAAAQPWETVLRTRLFEPAGMAQTGYDDVFAMVAKRVHGYQRAGSTLQNIVYKDHGAFAAGGLRSTAKDLLAWQHALSKRMLLKAASIDEMFTPVRDNYALGWQTLSLLERRAVNHSGGIDGFASHFVHYPDDGLTIIVLSNIAGEPAKTTACDLARIVFQAGPTVLDEVHPPGQSTASLNGFVGTYRDGDTVRRIELRAGRLVYMRGSSAVDLTPLSGSRFVMERTTTLAFDSTRSSFTVTDGCGTKHGVFKKSPIATLLSGGEPAVSPASDSAQRVQLRLSRVRDTSCPPAAGCR
jgi:CubicO group peptidase (beta-lactamase class C family)